jgi:hypothetical protein
MSMEELKPYVRQVAKQTRVQLKDSRDSLKEPQLKLKESRDAERANAFLRKLVEALEIKKFALQHKNETVVTGRVVRLLEDWETSAALRELLQNIVDHLQLFDPNTGMRNKAVDLEIFHPHNPAGHGGAADEEEDKADNGAAVQSSNAKKMKKEQIPLKVITFSCGDVVLCKIVVSNDELVIEQAYTYPLSPLMLYTGVQDKSKQDGNTAGGSILCISA